MIAAQGSDAEHLHESYISHINEALSQRPEGMAVTTHMCRGNFRSSWVAEGGYDFVAEALFGELEVDGFFMEWDDARSGGFEPLRFVPKGKQVVLGLVTTKRGELESNDDLKRRIEEASQYVDVDQLCLSPQCGFSSTVEGNALSRDEQAAKLAIDRGDRTGGVGLMRRALAGIVSAALLALAGCGDDGGSSGAKEEGGVTKVKVGVLPISNVAPLYLGMKKGFFKEEGLEVEPSIGQSGNELVTGMVSGSTEFAFLGYVPLMSARGQGLPVKVVANADNGAETAKDEWTLLLSKKGSPIKEPADLAGKTIAVNALKGVGEVEIKAALDKRGVDPDSIKLLEIPFPEMPAALDKGRVDVIWAPEPFLTSVLGEGGQDVEAPLTTLGPKFPNGTYAHDGEADRGGQGPGRALRTRDQQVLGLRDRPSRRGARHDPDVHEDPARAREEDPAAAVADRDRPGEAADPARLRGRAQGDREAAEARRRDLGGGRAS